MNEDKNLRFWKWAVILLVICNVGLILTVWVRPGLMHGPKPEQPRDFVIRNLKFSDDQVKQYDALIAVHKNAMNRLRKESMDYRQLLFANLKNSANNGINPDSLSQLIANDQKQIELVTYNHFAQVRAICTDAQKTEFDKIIGEVTRRMNGPARGGPGPHPPGDRQGPPEGREEGPPPNGHPGPPDNE